MPETPATVQSLLHCGAYGLGVLTVAGGGVGLGVTVGPMTPP